MFIRYLDYLSPPISIYYKGKLTHSSIASGIFSILTIISMIYLAVYFSLDLIRRENPNAYYYNSFVQDAGNFELNSTSLFHFINIIQNIRGDFSQETINFSAINIIGFQGAVDNFISLPEGQTKFVNHWLYGPCKKDIHGKDVKDLIASYDFFEKCACIQKYWDQPTQKYYEIGDPHFKWPILAKGTFNIGSPIYSIFITRCKQHLINEILGENSQCQDDEKFSQYFNIMGTRITNLYFINNYINLLNYYNPYSKFFFKIEEIMKPNQYTCDEININPSLVTTFNGITLNSKKEEKSYIFDRSVSSIVYSPDTNIYMSYTFFLRNTMNYYQRSYKKIQDIISSIGGISQVINIFAIYINKIYCNFIVLYDTEELLNSLITAEKRKHKKDSKKMNSRSKIKQLMEKDVKKNSSTKNIFKEEKNKKNKSKNNKSESDIVKSGLKSNNVLFNSSKEFEGLKTHASKVDIDILNKIETYKIDKSKKNFWNYLWYRLTFRKKNKYFKIYENFRIKIISEEHFMRNHLNIYNLMKLTEKKKHSRRNTNYHLSHIIKLI